MDVPLFSDEKYGLGGGWEECISFTTVPSVHRGSSCHDKKPLEGGCEVARQTGKSSTNKIESAPTALAGTTYRTAAGNIYRFDSADLSALARRYRVLLKAAVAQQSLASVERVLCTKMLDELENALSIYDSLAVGMGTQAEVEWAELELRWLCNQCERFWGPAFQAGLPTAERQQATYALLSAATDGELWALAILLRWIRSWMWIRGRCGQSPSKSDRGIELSRCLRPVDVLMWKSRELVDRWIARLRRWASIIKARLGGMGR